MRNVPISMSKWIVAERLMLSKGYLDTARTLLRVAHDMTNQTVADRLKAIAEDYQHRAEKALQVENELAQPTVRHVRAAITPE
jgi:hypothetical protein